MAVFAEDGKGILSKDYAKDAVQDGVASGAGIKRSTAGTTVVAAVLAFLTLFNGPFQSVFGNNVSPWLKFAVFAVITLVWGAIMVADALARKVPTAAKKAERTTHQVERTSASSAISLTDEQFRELLDRASRAGPNGRQARTKPVGKTG